MASGAFQIDSGAIGSWASGERVAQDLVRAAARADPAGRAEGVPCLDRRDGHAKFEAAAGVHDDLVLACALALLRLQAQAKKATA